MSHGSHGSVAKLLRVLLLVLVLVLHVAALTLGVFVVLHLRVMLFHVARITTTIMFGFRALRVRLAFFLHVARVVSATRIHLAATLSFLLLLALRGCLGRSC